MTDVRYVTVARVGDVPDGGVRVVRIDDLPIAIFRLGDQHFALEDVCTHDGGPLAEGFVEGDVIECPRHGARFDIRTGAVLAMPAIAPVPTYPVRVVGDAIQVGWPDAGDAPQVAATATPQQASRPESAVPAAPSAGATTPAGDASAPSQQELAVRSALETVMDPEIGLSVVDV